jgi:hypothetical protein
VEESWFDSTKRLYGGLMGGRYLKENKNLKEIKNIVRNNKIETINFT